jgi:hypothetical protein
VGETFVKDLISENKLTKNMAAPTRPPGPPKLDDPDMYYEMVKGSYTGICHICGDPGPVGNLCYRCNDREDKSVGTCQNCNHVGILHCVCTLCGKDSYIDEWPDDRGQCQKCRGYGDKGNLCSKCTQPPRRYE